MNILLFLVDVGRLDSPEATGGPVKAGVKNKKRKEGGRIKKTLTKEE